MGRLRSEQRQLEVELMRFCHNKLGAPLLFLHVQTCVPSVARPWHRVKCDHPAVCFWCTQFCEDFHARKHFLKLQLVTTLLANTFGRDTSGCAEV